jgi:hypothetical protein
MRKRIVMKKQKHEAKILKRFYDNQTLIGASAVGLQKSIVSGSKDI